MSTPSRIDVRRLAAARLISITGSQAAFTALLFTIYRRTGSPAWVSGALLATFGTLGILSPFAGSLGDRFDRRHVMIASDLAGAACFASLGLVHSPASLVALAFMAAVMESPFYSASTAAVPNLVSPEDLNWANGTIQLGGGVGYLAGPMLGGVLVAAIGSTAVFEANALSFVVSAMILRSVRGRFSGDRGEDGGDHHEHRGIRAGMRLVLRDRVLRTLTLAFTVFVLSVGSVVVAELPLVKLFHAGSLGYGLIGAMWGTGSLVGALAARKLTARTERRAMVALSFVTAAGLASVSVIPLFVPILGAMLVSGCSDAIVDVAAETLIQRRAPDAVRSRVVAAVDGLVLTAFAGSFLFAGVVVAAIGPKAAYAVAGAGCGLTGVLLFPILRERTDAVTSGPAGNDLIGEVGNGRGEGAPTNSRRPALELGGAAPTTGA